MSSIEMGVSAPPEIIQPEKPIETRPRPEARELSAQEITEAYEGLGILQAELPGKDPQMELIVSLGQPQDKFLGRLTVEHRQYTEEGNEAGIKKLQRINYLRKLITDEKGPDHRAEEVINRCYKHVNSIRKKAFETFKSLQALPKNPETKIRIDKSRQLVTRLSKNRQNIERIIQTGYPELWEKLHPSETPTADQEASPAETLPADNPETAIDEFFAKLEAEQGESEPEKPEFLTQEAWQTVYKAGLNYLETEKKNPDPKKEKETYGYFFVDPANPHLAEELRNLTVDQDKIIADLEANLETEKSPTKRLAIERDIERRKKETSWDNASDTIKKMLDPILKDKIRNDEALSPEEKQSIRDLIKTPIMQYPTEAEARAILEKLKASEPDSAVAMYARTEDGRPLKVFINKTNKEIETSLSLARGSRPDYGEDTKIISIIGSRIGPKKLAELKNK